MMNRFFIVIGICFILTIGIIGVTGGKEKQSPYLPISQPGENGVSGEFLSSDPRIAELVKAAGSGDIKKINQLVEAGVDPNGSPSSDGFTPLGWATHKNNKEAMKRLLDLGADPNKTFAIPYMRYEKLRPCTDCEAMDVAKDIEALELLLQNGADPNGNGYNTALLKNISDIEKVKLLIDYGADVNMPSYGYGKDIQVLENGEEVERGITRTYPLSTAIARRAFAVAKLLLDHGANTDLNIAYSRLKALMKEDLDPEQRKLGLELEHRIYERGGRYYPPYSSAELQIKGLLLHDESRMVDLKPGEPVPDFN